MIARDNETRARLNDSARAYRADAGELGEERAFAGTPVAVGDRVICRDNDARVQVDNGTRGTVRHVTAPEWCSRRTPARFANYPRDTSPITLSTPTA